MATERRRQDAAKPGPFSAVVGGSEGDETLLEPMPRKDEVARTGTDRGGQSGTRGPQGKRGPTVETGSDAERRDR